MNRRDMIKSAAALFAATPLAAFAPLAAGGHVRFRGPYLMGEIGPEIMGLPVRSGGGPVKPGVHYLFGEKGPELFSPNPLELAIHQGQMISFNCAGNLRRQ